MCAQHTGDVVLVGAQVGPDGAAAALVTAPAAPARSSQPPTVLRVVRADGDDALEVVLRAALAAASQARPTPLAVASVVLDVGPLLDHVLAGDPAQLDRVAVVRIGPRPASDPALERHPCDLVEALVAVRAVVPGGHDVLGHELRLLDRRALADALGLLAAAGAPAAAVVASGSAVQPAHEREVADAVQAALPAVRISVAHDFGGHGSAAREATVVLDAALRTTVDTLVERAQRVVSAHQAEPGSSGREGPVLRLARGDGGSLSAERARSAPAVVIGGSRGLQVLGAAHLAGLDTCRVLLPYGDGAHLVGGVRSGLVLVRPLEVGDPPTELVVPAAALQSARPPAQHAQPQGPAVVSDRGTPVAGQVPDVVPGSVPLDELACVGAALARPLAWLDEIAEISSADDLAAVRTAAVRRATALATANGAEPGSADVTEVSTVAVPYSRAGTVRVRVRVAGSGRA